MSTDCVVDAWLKGGVKRNELDAEVDDTRVGCRFDSPDLVPRRRRADPNAILTVVPRWISSFKVAWMRAGWRKDHDGRPAGASLTVATIRRGVATVSVLGDLSKSQGPLKVTLHSHMVGSSFGTRGMDGV